MKKLALIFSAFLFFISCDNKIVTDKCDNQCEIIGKSTCEKSKNEEGLYICIPDKDGCLVKKLKKECTCENDNKCKISCLDNPCGMGKCDDSNGKINCDCKDIGFTGNNCEIDINECENNPCNKNATCINKFGSFECKCNEGYEGNGVNCTDINECNNGTHNCDSNANCTNTEGSFNCECKVGYEGDGTKDNCIYICDATANLVVNDTNDNCICANGYHDEAGSCIEDQECQDNTCGRGKCTIVDGAISCNCENTGYTGDRCEVDIDECLDNPCDENATCTNNDGSFNCTCKEGYTGDGSSCEDINECLNNPCDENATCSNTPGNFECNCLNGYFWNGENCICPNGRIVFEGKCISSGNCKKRNYEGHEYHFCHIEKKWWRWTNFTYRKPAEKYCNENNHGHLLKIDNEEENNWISEKINNNYWIGLHDYNRSWEANNCTGDGCEKVTNRWKWIDKYGNDGDSNLNSSNGGYNNWNDGEPNNSGNEDCVEIYPNGKWNDAKCNKKKFFICEKE